MRRPIYPSRVRAGLLAAAGAVCLLAPSTAPAAGSHAHHRPACAARKAAVTHQRARLRRAQKHHAPAPALRGMKARLRKLEHQARCATPTSGPVAANPIPGPTASSASIGAATPVEAPPLPIAPSELFGIDETGPVPTPTEGVGGTTGSGSEPESEDGSTTSAQPTPLSIAVQGTNLVDGEGEPVQLHGVNFSGTMWKCLGGRAFASPTDESSLEALVSWHVDAVRIPLNEDCWLGINGAPTDISGYHEEIAAVVDRLNELGIYVILDLHWSAPGSTLSHLGYGFEGQFEMADADHAPAFWESVASYFREDHALLFDLFNEPFDISWSCWREGCWAPRGYETAGMQELVDAVRSTGATQPVLVGGLNWASQAGAEWLRNRPTDPAGQLVASVHAYGVRGNFDFNVGIVADQVPVVMSEIGEKDCADESLERLLPWADSEGVSYLAWAWYTGNCFSGPALISNYEGTPTPYGVGFREHLRATFPAPEPASG